MKPRWLTLTALMTFVYLIAVNGLVFPLIFPDGLAEKFANARPVERPLYHLLAFAATAILLTLLVERLATGSRPVVGGLLAGVLLGLLVALPEHLHLYAMTEAPASRQFIPVAWIAATWGLAGWLIGTVRARVAGRSR